MIRKALTEKCLHDKWWENSKRATEIREACEPAHYALQQLLWDEEISNKEKQDLTIELDKINGRLIELNVNKEENRNKTPEQIMPDPDSFAVHIASQLLSIIAKQIPNSRDAIPEETTKYKRKDGLPADTKDFFGYSSIDNLIQAYFQYED